MKSNSKADKLRKSIIRILNENKSLKAKRLKVLAKQKFVGGEEKIVGIIQKLKRQGKTKNIKQPRSTLQGCVTYLRTREAFWYWAVIVTTIATVAVVVLVPANFHPLSFARHCLGLVFVLWMPGYTLTRALFLAHAPTKILTENLDTIERIALSFGISLAIVPMVGLFLYYTPWSLQPTMATLSLALITIAFSTAGIMREHQLQLRETQKTELDHV